MISRPLLRIPLLVVGLAGCGGGAGPSVPSDPQLEVVTTSGAPLHAFAGDAIALKVVVAMPDGSTRDLAGDATVVWSLPGTVVTLPPESTATTPLPAPGPEPTAAWVDNTSRPDRTADLEGTLFVLDPGTVQNATLTVSATVSGGALPGSVQATIGIDPTPAGDWTRGAALYGAEGANCAACHGATGHGSPGAPEATSYLISGGTYDFPSPGINAEPGNLADDPAWSAALLAVAARADMDNGGVALRLPMPDWLATPNPATGAPLATQDFADIYAFLKTQTH